MEAAPAFVLYRMRLVLLAIVLLAAPALPVIEPTPPDPDALDQDVLRLAVERKRPLIEAEIAELKDHPWAGTYRFRPHLGGSVIAIAPRHGLIHTAFSCGGPFGFNVGRVVSEDSGILRMEFAEETASYFLESEVALATFDGRDYLVPARHMPQFCGFVNEFVSGSPWSAAAFGPFLCRTSGRSSKPNESGLGIVRVPDRWKPLLLDHAVASRIVEVTASEILPMLERVAAFAHWRRFTLTAIIDRGTAAGIVPSMRTSSADFPPKWHPLEIEVLATIDGERSTVRIRGSTDDPNDRGPEPGFEIVFGSRFRAK